MRISTRVVWGNLGLVLLLSATLIYQVSAVQSVQEISSRLSEITFRAVEISLKLIRQRDLVEEFTRKYLAIRDPGARSLYYNRLRAAWDGFHADLGQVNTQAQSTAELQAISRAIESWARFTEDFRAATAPGKPQPDRLPPELEEDLNRLRESIDGIYEETLRPITAWLALSKTTSQRARRVSWLVTGSAIMIGALVSFLLMRSVSRPLRQLAEGTRAIARGNLSYRFGTPGDEEFHDVARDFNMMVRRLNELDQMKKDFVSHVSHEIKSPLASMRETVELLLEGIPGELTDGQRRLLELNLKSNRRLFSMIENLLDLSRMEAGVMEYEMKHQDLVPLIQASVAEFEPLAHEKRLEIRCGLPDGPALVPCDGDRIIQVLDNLLGNAVKFSPRDSSIRVSAVHGPDSGIRTPAGWAGGSHADGGSSEFWMVEVSDSGPGIPDPEKEAIFDRYRQVRQGPGTPAQGTGLGLAICRTIVSAHGGTIWVDDNPGGGSCFRFVIPCSRDRERVGE